jgi:hypothetical protein
MAKTEAKKGKLEEDVASQTSRIDKFNVRSAYLKEGFWRTSLPHWRRSRQRWTKIRQESHADYETAKADLELGLNGVRQAVFTLRNYYEGAAAIRQGDSKFGAFVQQP